MTKRIELFDVSSSHTVKNNEKTTREAAAVEVGRYDVVA